MAGASRASAEERALLGWVASLGAVTSEALARRAGVRLGVARGRLRGLRRRGLLSYSKPATAVPGLFAINRAGLRAAAVEGMEACTVAATMASHYATCALVAVELERRYRGARVIGERELRRDERLAKAVVASARTGTWRDGGPRLHRPDLVVWTDDEIGGRPLAVEVELTIKSPPARMRILRAWERCELVSGVLYAAAPRAEAPLRRTIESLQAGRRVAVVPLASLTCPAPEEGVPCA